MEKVKEVIIPKEKAVFWMDGNGRWTNENGPFKHKKLIDYFNKSIGWDAKGFFVSQELNGICEKVYFRYQETALFAVDASIAADIELLLNTRQRIPLDCRKLYVKNDRLFMRYQDTSVKFTDRCMLQVSAYIEEVDDAFYFRFNETRCRIPFS
jgi:hypothetical protein